MKEMHLHFLGTAGYHPSDERHTSCLLIPEVGLMLDAGTGVYRSIPLITTDTLDIVLSHAHLDHIFGLTFLLDVIYKTKLRSIRVFGESEKLSAVRKHLFSDLLFPVLPPIEWVRLEDLEKPFEMCGARMRWFRLNHPGGSVGYRFDWPGLSFAYVTDTTCREDSDYWQELVNVDHLVHECNFTDEEHEFAIKTGHSFPSPVLAQASNARIRNLYLSHLNPLASEDDPASVKRRLSTLNGAWPRSAVVARDTQIVALK
jgi:ribonuclease Z